MDEKVIPGVLLVGFFRRRISAVLHGGQILVGLRHPAEVTEVPVEDVVFGFHFC